MASDFLAREAFYEFNGSTASFTEATEEERDRWRRVVTRIGNPALTDRAYEAGRVYGWDAGYALATARSSADPDAARLRKIVIAVRELVFDDETSEGAEEVASMRDEDHPMGATWAAERRDKATAARAVPGAIGSKEYVTAALQQLTQPVAVPVAEPPRRNATPEPPAKSETLGDMIAKRKAEADAAPRRDHTVMEPHPANVMAMEAIRNEAQRDASVAPIARAPSPGALWYGMEYSHLQAIEFSDDALLESLICKCGTAYVAHDEDGIGATDCGAFFLAEWLGRTVAPDIQPAADPSAPTITIGTGAICVTREIPPGGHEAAFPVSPQANPPQTQRYGVPLDERLFGFSYSKLGPEIHAANEWAKKNNDAPWAYAGASELFLQMAAFMQHRGIMWLALMTKVGDLDRANPKPVVEQPAPEPKQEVAPDTAPEPIVGEGSPLPVDFNVSGKTLAMLSKLGLDSARALADFRDAMKNVRKKRWATSLFPNWIEARAKAAAK